MNSKIKKYKLKWASVITLVLVAGFLIGFLLGNKSSNQNDSQGVDANISIGQAFKIASSKAQDMCDEPDLNSDCDSLMTDSIESITCTNAMPQDTNCEYWIFNFSTKRINSKTRTFDISVDSSGKILKSFEGFSKTINP